MVTQKHYDNWTKSIVVPPGIRPRKMPARRGIRTQKWSNPPLCPVGGRWGMTLIGALCEFIKTSLLINDADARRM